MKLAFLTALVGLLFFFGCKGGAGSGAFAVFQGQKDGRPLFATIDTGLRGNKPGATYPWFLGITTSLTNPTRDGLTTEQEASSLNDWEDSLEKQLAGTCRFVYVGRVTWNGKRQLLYYVDKPDSIESKLRKLADEHPARAFDIHVQRDDQWNQVSAYLEKNE